MDGEPLQGRDLDKKDVLSTQGINTRELKPQNPHNLLRHLSNQPPRLELESPESANRNAEGFNTGISIDRSNRTSVLIEDAIRAGGGRIPYSRFMDISLFGPEGYYSSGRADIGSTGGTRDFETDTSFEPFNKTIGNAVLKVWESMGRPDTFDIVEMGAGTGIMAKDMLVWARETQPEFYSALRYVILEYGDLREKQRATIGEDKHNEYRKRQLTQEENAQDLEKVQWIQGSAHELSLHNIEDIEGVFLSNELPDAFPVEVVKRVNGKMKQKYVTLVNDQWIEVWEDLSDEVSAYIEEHNITISDNGSEEPININAAKWQKEVDRALKRGAIFTIDYGRKGVFGDVYPGFRATRTYPPEIADVTEYRRAPSKFYRHETDVGIQFRKKYSEYRNPGRFDITSNVNFAVQEDVAIDDGVTVAFSGDEEQFLLHNGFADFFNPSPITLSQIRSIKELTLLYNRLVWNASKFNKTGFYAHVLTKGVDLAETLPTYPTMESFRDIGFKLQIGRPNATVTIEIDEKGNKDTFEAQLDEEGNLHFDGEKLKPPMPYRTGITCLIKEGSDILLDTSNKYSVKEVTERSGYDFDIDTQPSRSGEPFDE